VQVYRGSGVSGGVSGGADAGQIVSHDSSFTILVSSSHCAGYDRNGTNQLRTIVNSSITWPAMFLK